MRIEELTEVYTEEEILDFEELSQEEQDKIFAATLKKIRQKRKIVDIFRSFSMVKKIAAAVIIGLVFMGTTALAVEVVQNIKVYLKTENMVNENSLGIKFDVTTSLLCFWSPNVTQEEVEESIKPQGKGRSLGFANIEITDKEFSNEMRKKMANHRSRTFADMEEAREYYSVPIVIGDYLEDNYEICNIKSETWNTVDIDFYTKDEYSISVIITDMMFPEGSRWFQCLNMYNEKLVQSENMKTASGETVSVFIGEIKNKVYAYIVDANFIYEILVDDSDNKNIDFDAMLEETKRIVSSLYLTENVE